jgi:hypothetical protein
MSGTVYTVARVDEPIAVDGTWDKACWKPIVPLSLDYSMGEKPAHRPRTEAKLAYDEHNLYVIFRVEDRYVRSVTTELHGPVCTDSCVEFFFTPEKDKSAGYMNLEINCGGTVLFFHQLARNRNITRVAASDCEQIEIAHSLPQIVDPERTEPTTWTVEYRLPLSVVAKYHALTAPASGVIWRANFYKCADNTSHPHWLTWSRVERSTPDFHRPEFFGVLLFE